MCSVLLPYSYVFTAPVKRCDSLCHGRDVVTNHVLSLPWKHRNNVFDVHRAVHRHMFL